jgi:ferredoxin
MSFISREWINDKAKAYMQSPDNDLHMPGGPEPAFGEALLGFAAGDDPIWQSYKSHVDERHWTPQEAWALAFPQNPAKAGELTVLSWILPQTEATKRDNRAQTAFPAERWARNRIMGENIVHNGLRDFLLGSLKQAGVEAFAPVRLEQWARLSSERYTFASTWSERHAAHAAGLGTFGLSDGLITPLGKAMRTGSLILRLHLEPTVRIYASHREYCLFFNSGICGKCAKKCPVGSVSKSGRNKERCSNYLRPVTQNFVREQYGFEGYGCGLCQVGVPCESGIPPRPRRNRHSKSAGRLS